MKPEALFEMILSEDAGDVLKLEGAEVQHRIPTRKHGVRSKSTGNFLALLRIEEVIEKGLSSFDLSLTLTWIDKSTGEEIIRDRSFAIRIVGSPTGRKHSYWEYVKPKPSLSRMHDGMVLFLASNVITRVLARRKRLDDADAAKESLRRTKRFGNKKLRKKKRS